MLTFLIGYLVLSLVGTLIVSLFLKGANNEP